MRNKVIFLLLVVVGLGAYAGLRVGLNLGSQHLHEPLSEVQALLPDLPHKPRVALVLGGGGARGFAHIGVLEVFEQEGIPVDLIVGCSAGSIVGVLYGTHSSVQEAYQASLSLKRRDMIRPSIFSAIKGLWNISAPIKGYFFKQFLERKLPAKDFSELRVPLVAIATDAITGECVPIGKGDIVSAVQASCSFPPVFSPVHIDGRTLIDGCVSNPIPIDIARQLGADCVFVVEVAALLPSKPPSNIYEITTRALHISYLELSKKCGKEADCLIVPNLGSVSVFADDCQELLYQRGKEAARQALPQIKEVLRQKKIPLVGAA